MRVNDVDDVPALATIAVTKFGAFLDPDAFPRPLAVADALLAALAYAEKAEIACMWIDDPSGRFPPNRRPASLR
jgi:hypothetical protein